MLVRHTVLSRNEGSGEGSDGRKFKIGNVRVGSCNGEQEETRAAGQNY